MNSANRDYLRRCLELHGELKKKIYGREEPLQEIEDAVKHVKRDGRISYDDVERIRDSEIWNADDFGYWPLRAELAPVLEEMRLGFFDNPKNEKTIIRQLFEKFRQIEPVSVILRFVEPERFGIISPPVEQVLGLGPFGSHVERYRAYLCSLRAVRAGSPLRRVADVDMALWVLQVGVLEGKLREKIPDEIDALQAGFRQDVKLREVRVANLTKQLFKDLSWTELAEALLPTDHALAGPIAGVELERLVKERTNAKPEDGLRYLVRKQLPSLVSEEDAALVQEAVDIRNEAVHRNPPPPRERVGRLVHALKLESLGKGRRAASGRGG